MANEEKAKEPAIGNYRSRGAMGLLSGRCLRRSDLFNFTTPRWSTERRLMSRAHRRRHGAKQAAALAKDFLLAHACCDCDFGALVFTAYYGIRFLMTKRACYDTRARVATEIALVFVLCTMASGDVGALRWGVWWTWGLASPRISS
ncbi:MAG: hypothetical protein ACLT98_02730 [Eggerthellaceae bacterium]